MNLDRFRDTPAGRVIRAGTGDAAYWAFVPAPLPPPLELDTRLARVLSGADRALGELAGLGRAMPNPHLLIGPFLRREAVLSSRIEGTQADLADLYAYEAGQFSPAERRSGASEADVREVLNYVRALEYGLERVAELPVSLRLLRELHERLMTGVRGNQATPGELRRSQNWIGRPGCTLNDAEYVPPPVAEMQAALDLFEKYLYMDDGYPPMVRLAFIHYQFEAIHPFLDGNGRIGRLLISLLLVNWDLLSLPLLYLSAYFEQHRQEYYDLLLAVSQRSAWREWLAFFLTGVAEQARDANTRAKRLQDLQLEWRRRLTQARTSALLPRLADALFDSPVITIPQAQRILQVTYHSAQHNVEKLVEAGILTPHSGSATGKTFRAEDILHTTGEDIVSELYF